MENRFLTKTKILSTIGPASAKQEVLRSLILSGVDGFRLNFSHGKLEELTEIVKKIRQLSKELNVPVSVLGDLQGPKIRIGEIEGGAVEIKEGDTIDITVKNVVGSKFLISTSYKNLAKEMKRGQCILIDDGLIKLKVINTNKDKGIVTTEVCEGGMLKSKKGMNMPGANLRAPSLTERDIENLDFAIKHKLDFIALSFVRDELDVVKLKKIISEKKSDIPVIAKIELVEGVKNFESILKVSDGIMVARGDLGVELEPQEVPLIQKMIIKRCNEERKLVITATQMLESMVNNPLPTRAEASDVANAVFDGTDVVMLSAETSVGKFPVRAVQTMNKILQRTEEGMETMASVNFSLEKEDHKIIHAVAKSVTFMADQIYAKAIIPVTHSGYTAIILSKYKPFCKILAVTPNEATTRRLNLYRGVRAFYIKKIDNLNETIKKATALFTSIEELKHNDDVIFVGSLTSGNKGVQNMIKVEKI